ncbi:ElaB protein [Salmonella enterica subsp. enterica serovar Typhimurium]|nr:ElaB protein [Salmonella enterica subsp. enterica serovar Typhimurium]
MLTQRRMRMSYQFGESRVDDDLTLLSETLEEVLRSSGDPADQKYIELKARAEQALEEVKNRVSHASDSYYYRAKQAVYKADDYVHEKPWQGIGVGAAVGLVLGLLLARR